MKKILICFLATLFLIVPVSAQEETGLTVWTNLVAVEINGEDKPVRNMLSDGTTYIALRDISELLDCVVSWDAETRTAIITTGGFGTEKEFEPLPQAEEITISVLKDYVSVQIDGERKDVRNFLYDGTTYIALRDVSELLGCQVDWVAETRTAVITAQPASENPTVMVVNGISVDKATFLAAVKEVSRSQNFVTTDDLINAAISQVVYQTVVTQRAQEVIPDVITQAEQSAQASLFSLYLNYGEETANQMLTYYGLTTEEYLTSATFEYVANTLFQYQIANDNEYRTVKDSAKAYYDSNKDAYKEHCVQVKHILIPFADGVSEEETLKKAQDIASRAKPTNFDALLSENNNDPGQTETGYFVMKNSNFVQAFEDASLALKKGEISKPVKTDYGYHIIYATEVYTHIPYEEFETPYVSEQYNLLFTEQIEGWIEAAEIAFVAEDFGALIS